jgi:alkanesulfonate monooxygenase SsuD/methylene tetrahydromethanopterin reductase-like flavin-dependent oxidoreductase (luciferase family)
MSASPALRACSPCIARPGESPAVKFGNFLFPESRDAARDAIVIEETIAEARLSDELGFDVIWLAEHHFDGICAYVDPVSFAAALAMATRQAKLGFAVLQTSLHHPIRLAEQLSLIDTISKGRLIVGLGRGTAYNIYDYQGYGIDPDEAQARLEEAESILFRALSGEPLEHHGRFWNLTIPMLRPRPYTLPYPPVIRGASGEASMIELARQGRPFLMNVQSLDVTRHRMELYRRTLREHGHDEAAVMQRVEQCWVWRNVVVAETDQAAAAVGIPAFEAMQAQRAAMRERVFRETGQRLEVHAAGRVAPPPRTMAEHALIHGSPATVAERLAAVAATGVGGVIMQFRLGPMPYDVAAQSLTLFMQKVVPQLAGI